MSQKIMFARILNLDYLNNMDQNQLDLSDNDMTKNINNLQVSMEDNKIKLTWNDCVDNHWKKSYVVRGENTIPTSVYNGSVVTSYTEKNKYANEPFIDSNVEDNMLYCYRVFSEMQNQPEFYSGFKNIFYVYVSSVDTENGGVPEYIHANKVIQDPLHKFVTENQITTWNNKSDFSGSYDDLVNKPKFATVAMTGSYKDLLDKPEIGGNDFSGDYNDLLNKPELSIVATSGSYNDLLNKPKLSTVAASGSYNDLLNKPDVYSKLEVYNKSEIDSKFEDFQPNIPVGSSTKRYKADETGDCYVVATGDGVTFSKEGTNAVITVPDGVELLSAQVRFSAAEVGTNGKCKIKYGTSYNYTDNVCIPSYSIMNDVDSSRAYNVMPVTAANLNSDNGNAIEFTGLKANIGIIAKLTF